MRGGRVALGAVALSALLAVALLGPALAPGYVLGYDLVFTPRQWLVPASVGLGDVLPRAVPQDAVLAALTSIAPGALWEHLMLVGVVLGSAWGVARILRDHPGWVRACGALLYVWSAYLAERLVLGSWPVLVAYAVLPWALLAALAVRRREPGSAGRLLLLCALASLAPTGGILALLVALPVALGPGSRVSAARRWGLAAAAVALQLTWLVPALVSPVAPVADPAGAAAFALRSEGPWGPLLTALGTGGAWSGEVVPASRTLGLGLVGTVIVLALAGLGARGMPGLVGRSGTWTLGALSMLGLLVAVGWPLVDAAVGGVPGAGLLRDGQKWLAPLALLLAVAGAQGASRLAGRVSDPLNRRVLAAALVALPVLALPDAAWGVGGRVAAVSYPEAWWRMREAVAAAPTGDMTVLPWGSFRSFAWNDRRTMLDPAPRWVDRGTVVDDRLLVQGPDGLVVIGGESERAAAVGAAVEAGVPLAPVLREKGVGLVLVEHGTPGAVPARALEGLSPLLEDQQLSLYAVPGGAQAPQPAPWRVWTVAVGWVVALGVVLGAALAALRARIGRGAGTGVVTSRSPGLKESA